MQNQRHRQALSLRDSKPDVLFLPPPSCPLRFNFPLKRWTVWTWNSRRNLAEAAEFHIGSAWMKHSTQPRLKPGPCLPKLLCMSASLDWKPNPKPGDFWTLEALLYKDRSCQTRAFLISQTSTVISCVYTFLFILWYFEDKWKSNMDSCRCTI